MSVVLKFFFFFLIARIHGCFHGAKQWQAKWGDRFFLPATLLFNNSPLTKLIAGIASGMATVSCACGCDWVVRVGALAVCLPACGFPAVGYPYESPLILFSFPLSALLSGQRRPAV